MGVDNGEWGLTTAWKSERSLGCSENAPRFSLYN